MLDCTWVICFLPNYGDRTGDFLLETQVVHSQILASAGFISTHILPTLHQETDYITFERATRRLSTKILNLSSEFINFLLFLKKHVLHIA